MEEHLWITIGYPEDIEKAEAVISSLLFCVDGRI
jgi:hypothetical protein